MKFFYALPITLLFVSCADPLQPETADNISLHQRASLIPLNSDNPYEAAGVLHGEIYDAYRQGPDTGTVPATTVDRIAMVATAFALDNDTFVALAGTNYTFADSQRIEYILTHDCKAAIIDAALATSQARNSLSNFISTLTRLCKTEDNYATIYDYVVTYEDGILTDTGLSAAEKKTILYSTSIARHAVYRKKKRPKKNTDPEWDLMVGNIMAGTEGAGEGMKKAIMMSVVANLSADE